MEALANPSILHGAVENSFTGERKRNLWRIDLVNEKHFILVVSEEKPDYAVLCEKFGFVNHEKKWETKEYSTLVSKLEVGEIWNFRLKANPTRSSFTEKQGKNGRGKVYAHVTLDQQKEWLLKKARDHGFETYDNDFDIINTQWYRFSKHSNPRHRITLQTTTFEGRLTITDSDRFIEALKSGIGRGKAYGCGLITIAR